MEEIPLEYFAVSRCLQLRWPHVFKMLFSFDELCDEISRLDEAGLREATTSGDTNLANVAAVLVGFFAIFHGHAHGTELPAGQSGLLYSMGFVIATGCLHGIGIIIGLVHRWPAGKLALRGAGALIAAMGIFFLWQAVA